MHAKMVGKLIGKQDLIGIPFAGGLSELPYMNARQILVNDRHSELLNLYRVLMENGHSLKAELESHLYHPSTLEEAKKVLESDVDSSPKLIRAASYFIVNWMTRCSGGTDAEQDGSLAMRWTASGGSSIARWNSAVEGLPEWATLLRSKCECTCLDWRDFAKKWKDRKGHALYLDPPWIDAGDDYLHKFSIEDHFEMASWANSLKETRVVIRHSDHPKYRFEYPEGSVWSWLYVDATTQAGNKTGEVLIFK